MASLLSASAAEDRVAVAPLGNKVEVKLQTTSSTDDYGLESRAHLMEGEQWAPLLQFRGSSGSRSYVDALCGTMEQRYFRLRRLLDAPPVEVSNFRLLDTAGGAHELYYQSPSSAVAVLLVGRQTDAATRAVKALEAVRARVGGDRLVVWVVSASTAEERDPLASWAGQLPAGVPVLQDTTQALHRTLGTGQVPEVVLVSTLDWSMAYRGPVEDVVDTGEATLKSQPLSAAVDEVLQDKLVSVSRLATLGESAGIRSLGSVSYAKDVAPILLNHCMPCHRPGDIAPWSMTNHAVVQKFSRVIKSAVLAGNMPPWHADPKHQSFANSKALPAEDVDRLIAWIDQGSQRGAGEDPLEKGVTATTEDDVWPLGKPDAVITIDPQQIPASGTVDYRYLFASSPFSGDVWLRGVAVKPGARSVVHHCLVFKGNLTELLALKGGLAGFFAGYVPGMEQVPFPEGTGKFLKKGDIIVFQMHYTTSGTAATDQTQLGLYLAPSKPSRELVTSAAYNTSFSIPPKATDSPVSATRSFAKKSTIYELSPHMHYRGSRARFTLVYPDGRREVLLSVPKYFFDWQALYRLQSPKEVPAGTTLVCDGGFDNSPLNRFNPDPSATVKFGEQSWEEMFIGYVNFSEAP